MVDEATTIPRAKLGNRIGQLDRATLNRVSQALVAFLDLV
jgi:mRNA-degrading endonuclease toxin of MazEF toxin-antitoxin module